MVCHSQHTYVFTLVALQVLAKETNGGVNMKRFSQEITRCAQERYYINFIIIKLKFVSLFGFVKK